ncbi:hypothetical protein ACFSPU_08885 [Haoranjiania flava]|uniref:Outer membrane protein beta-barrel domain-containing protein n=1 Tax=Haoranjiania flava TaxID=1856322 RepID=A0AAE3LJA8_9BACT|nr:hypothetical protein [Haoranjiania flava]MCU7693209.1 hypothetical protein [Haoranjiania flava]
MKYIICLAVLLLPLSCLAQLFDQIEGAVGLSVQSYTISEKTGFIKRAEGRDGAFHISILGRRFISSNPKFSYRYGIGFAREQLAFFPLMKVSDINGFASPGYDTLTVAEVGNWDWQFIAPADISYELFKQTDIYPPLIVLPGMRLRAGIENRFSFHRINTDVVIVKNYDEEKDYAYTIDNKDLRERLGSFYSDNITRYRLMADAGAEFFFYYVKIGAVAGAQYKMHLLSPVNSKIRRPSSFGAYIGISYRLGK